MKYPRSQALCAGAACALLLAGCSLDTAIWGSDGARVIETTDALIHDLGSGGDPDVLCADARAELGTANQWKGRSAGEPERFVADYWEEQAALDPQWSINIEGLPDDASEGDSFPGDVFYRETDEGLCVIDIAWSTLASD